MEIKQWKIIEKKVSELKPHPHNPRKMGLYALRGLGSSMEMFGNVEPIVWNKRFNRVLSGHQRLKVLKDSENKITQVVAVDLPEEEERALMIVLNNPYIRGEFLPETVESIELLKKKRPEIYEEMMLGSLQRDIESMVPKVKDADPEDMIPEMEILPYEHWDYIVAVFKDSREWMAALDLLGIKKTKYITKGGYQKIGLGRVIDGKRLVDLLSEKERGKSESSNNEPGKA